MTSSGEKHARPRVGLVTLGCPKNQVDSEILLGRLARAGYELTTTLEEADTVIVNTCGFVEEAKQESIDAILDVAALKEGGLGRLVVAGCMVNRYASDLAAAIPEIDGFLGLDDLDRVEGFVEIEGPRPVVPAPSRALRVFDHNEPRVVERPWAAYLKVAEGCDNPCTFCAIPHWRGDFRSRTLESLVREAKELESRGAREISLVAQDTTRYGEDLGMGREGLRRLVLRLLEETEIPWIRFLYAYPTTLDPGLLDLMGREPRFCSYLDIPLQHSHREILRSMQRGGEGESYLRLLETAREKVPDLFLRSTFIAGFPGESEAHFEHLLDFITRARFDHLGAFAFSPEPGTPAAALPGRPSRRVAVERRERLLEAQRPISLASRRSLVGERLEVLVEGACGETEHLLEGRHQGMAPEIDGRLLIADGSAAAGAFAIVEIVDGHADDLVGHIVSAEDGSRRSPA